MASELDRTFSIYAKLISLCCIVHFVNHLGPARFESPSWWLAVATIAMSLAVLQAVSLSRFLLVCTFQVLHAISDAPFNPDHWLLLFFVNVATLCAAGALWLRHGVVDAKRLWQQLVPVGRLLFLICYGFAAFAKFNTHFLGATSSCGYALAEIQLGMSPWLKYVSCPPLAGWLTAVCESGVALLLLSRATRRYGILLGVLFHTALVVSPAIAVFDFTMTVYTMLFLFTPPDFADGLIECLDDLRTRFPTVGSLLRNLRLPLLAGIGIVVVGRSSMGLPMYDSRAVGMLSWWANMSLAAVVIFSASRLWHRSAAAEPASAQWHWRPTLAVHYLILLVALFNGMCPYLGLKTQGSFTMFSNLRTEGGQWNHIVVPAAVRIFDGYQDDLWQVAKIDDPRIQRDFVAKRYLVPAFEIQRASAENPDMGLTLVRDGHEITVQPARLAPSFATTPSWITRKLMIFRPVTVDGSPYCGN